MFFVSVVALLVHTQQNVSSVFFFYLKRSYIIICYFLVDGEVEGRSTWTGNFTPGGWGLVFFFETLTNALEVACDFVAVDLVYCFRTPSRSFLPVLFCRSWFDSQQPNGSNQNIYLKFKSVMSGVHNFHRAICVYIPCYFASRDLFISFFQFEKPQERFVLFTSSVVMILPHINKIVYSEIVF